GVRFGCDHSTGGGGRVHLCGLRKVAFSDTPKTLNNGNPKRALSVAASHERAFACTALHTHKTLA
ncbi:hypothetical protein M9458_031869, partial [Cirrhinus mrigala]